MSSISISGISSIISISIKHLHYQTSHRTSRKSPYMMSMQEVMDIHSPRRFDCRPCTSLYLVDDPMMLLQYLTCGTISNNQCSWGE